MDPTAVTVNELVPVNSGGRVMRGRPGSVDVRVGIEKVDGSGILPRVRLPQFQRHQLALPQKGP